MNTHEIVVHLAEQLHTDEAEMRLLVDRVTCVMADELTAHESFRLPGLGTFGTTWHAAHRWYDPMLRRVRRLPEHFGVYFRAARSLKQRLNSSAERRD